LELLALSHLLLEKYIHHQKTHYQAVLVVLMRVVAAATHLLVRGPAAQPRPH
jgi:hypothetical protein